MQADEAKNLVGKQWSSWKNLNPRNLIYILDGYGVYIIRAVQHQVPRLNGHSDILYVGRGKLKNRLGKCLNYRLGYRYWPTESGRLYRVERQLELLMEFSYFVTDSYMQAETSILDEYEKQHLELPPLNQQRGYRSKLPY